MSGDDAAREGKGRGRENPLKTVLGRRLLGWFLLLALVPLLASIAMGFLRSHRIIEQVLDQSLDAVTEVQVRHLHNRVDRYLAFLRAVAVGNEFLASGARAVSEVTLSGMEVAANQRAILTYLQRQLDELPDFAALRLVSLTGDIVASTFPASGTGDLLSEVRSPEPVRILRPENGGRPPNLEFAVPVTGITGIQVGYLVGTLGPDDLAAFFQIPEHVGGDIESFILDAGWRPLYVSHVHGPVDFASPLPTPLRDLPLGQTASYRDRQGAQVVGRAAMIPGTSWIYVTEQPDTHALGALRGLRRASILIALVFAAAVVAAAWFVSGGIVAPVHRLLDAARSLGAGDLGARVESTSSDEIGALGKAFNEMAAELGRSAAKVKDLHQREIERAGQLASVGELAAGIAHEIKNPLAGVSSGIDLLENRLDQGLSTEDIRRQIRSELRRMDRAIRDLLSFARPREPQVGRVSPSLLVNRAVGLIRPQAEAAGVRVEERIHPISERVRVDPELLTQALVNLAMNGIQAMDPGGVLAFSAGKGNGEVRIGVSDTGKGIAEGDTEKIFKPFFTARHRGTGLGLTITRSIVERHGGRLEVESAPGVGSRFTIVLPPMEEEAAR